MKILKHDKEYEMNKRINNDNKDQNEYITIKIKMNI